MRNRALLLVFCSVLVIGAVEVWRSLSAGQDRPPEGLEAFSVEGRPRTGRHLFDYAGVLRHYEEGANVYLGRMASRFHVEPLIVSVPALPEGYVTETLAVELLDRWRIGAAHEGRGLLLLLVDDTKQVKLEVGYELEGVFTDGFSGYVEDLQLRPYYRAGDLGTGLVAVMEMLEQRLQLEGQAGYAAGKIARADAALLSGGAGATRSLAAGEAGGERAAAPAASPPGQPGARSPEEAWEILLAKWAGEGAGFDVDVYTRMTRLAMGDADRPDPRTLRWLEHWRGADYQVRSDGDHAVIWFGAVDGWENSPFLFCNTGAGWKFDIVHQRRLVVMAEAPKWQVAQGPYPYTALMREAWQSTGKDLPLAGADLYRCSDDEAVAARMAELQAAIEADAGDAGATLELMALRVITGQRPNLVRPLIESAKRLAPESAEPWKYSAIFNVNSFFQYRTALADIERFIALRPNDPFGHDVKGFLLYRLGEYRDSIDALGRAVALDPDDGYAYALMARDYALLHRDAKALAKARYRDRALALREKAAGVTAADGQRLAWLDGWLERRL